MFFLLFRLAKKIVFVNIFVCNVRKTILLHNERYVDNINEHAFIKFIYKYSVLTYVDKIHIDLDNRTTKTKIL